MTHGYFSLCEKPKQEGKNVLKLFGEGVEAPDVLLRCDRVVIAFFTFDLLEFKEPRVSELWEMARTANLSNDELDSLKVRFPIPLK